MTNRRFEFFLCIQLASLHSLSSGQANIFSFMINNLCLLNHIHWLLLSLCSSLQLFSSLILCFLISFFTSWWICLFCQLFYNMTSLSANVNLTDIFLYFLPTLFSLLIKNHLSFLFISSILQWFLLTWSHILFWVLILLFNISSVFQ